LRAGSGGSTDIRIGNRWALCIGKLSQLAPPRAPIFTTVGLERPELVSWITPVNGAGVRGQHRRDSHISGARRSAPNSLFQACRFFRTTRAYAIFGGLTRFRDQRVAEGSRSVASRTLRRRRSSLISAAMGWAFVKTGRGALDCGRLGGAGLATLRFGACRKNCAGSVLTMLGEKRWLSTNSSRCRNRSMAALPPLPKSLLRFFLTSLFSRLKFVLSKLSWPFLARLEAEQCRIQSHLFASRRSTSRVVEIDLKLSWTQSGLQVWARRRARKCRCIAVTIVGRTAGMGLRGLQTTRGPFRCALSSPRRGLSGHWPWQSPLFDESHGENRGAYAARAGCRACSPTARWQWAEGESVTRMSAMRRFRRFTADPFFFGDLERSPRCCGPRHPPKAVRPGADGARSP